MSDKADDAGSAQIKVLKGLAAVRKRPQMYIGDTGDGSGLHNMVYEVVDNAIDEALAGLDGEVTVTLNADGSATVRDNGRGLPTDIHGGEDDNAYEISGGLHIAGVSVVNALSTCLELKIWRDGKEHFVRFRNGVAETPLKVLGPSDGRSGTEITFSPSLETFHNVMEFDHDTLEQRLRQLAIRNLGMRVLLRDDRHAEKRCEDIRYDGGGRVHYMTGLKGARRC